VIVVPICGGFKLRKKRVNNIFPTIRNVIIQWWIEETCVSLNKSEMTRKRLGPGLYDEKSRHFLMET
jgi:hypothetical protein